MAFRANALNITAQLRLDIKDFASHLSRASQQMSSFAKNSLKPLKDMDGKLHTIGLGLRDVARIASGILIAQAFYRGTQAISEATNALTKFNEQLDYANVTYTALFGSSDVSARFLETLKEQSIETIYSFEDLTQASKKLLAYGIDYKNVAYITEGLGNLAAMSGDTAAMDRISYALGQIYAKGTIKAEEMRQLANAYVPIQKILKESFNLTDEQLGNVGALRIPAEQAINAIVDYANTRFAEVGDAAMLTITGLKSRIVDSFKVTGSEMTKPLTNAFKSFLAWVNKQFNNIREAFKAGGSGGVFEYLVPDEGTRQQIRQFLASLGNMVMSIIRLLASMAPIVGTAFNGFVTAYNIVSPGITFIINLLSAMVSAIANSKVAMNILTGAIIAGAAAWTIYKAHLLSAALLGVLTKGIYAVARGVMVLSTVIVKSPIVGVLGIVAIALVAVAGASDKARNAISGFFDKMQDKFNGLGSDDILQVKDGMEQTAEASDEFNNALEGSGESLDELTKKAADAKKGLLSFDEVFKLNDTNDETSVPDYEGILEGLDISGDTLLPEIPDFSDYTNKFVDGLFGDLWASVKRIASGAASGALIGGLIGFAIGGLVTKTMAGALTGAKWGARIGTAVGGGFATFWGDSYEQMQSALNKITIAGGIGVLIGGLTGMVIAAFATTGLTGKARVDAVMLGGKIGTALGGLIGTGIGGFWSMAEDGFNNSLSGLITGGSIGALVGGLTGMVIAAFATSGLTGKERLKAILTGGAWGSGIGGLIAGSFGAFWGSASEEMRTAISSIGESIAVGTLLGGLVGLIIGAFATRSLGGALTGAKWGSAIGSILGGILTPFWTSASEELKNSIKAIAIGTATGALIGGLVGLVLGAFTTKTLEGALTGAKLGASIGAVLGGAFGPFWAAASDELKNTITTLAVGAATGALIGGLVGLVLGAFTTKSLEGALTGAKWGAAIGTVLGGAFRPFWDNATDELKKCVEGLLVGTATGALIGGLVGMILGAFVTKTIGGAMTGAKYGAAIGGIIGGTMGTAFNDMEDELGSRLKSLFKGVSAAAKGAFFGGMVGMIIGAVIGAFAGGVGAIPGAKLGASLGAAAGGLIGLLVQKLNDQGFGKAIGDWWKGLWNPDNWASGWNSVKKWFSDLWSGIANWFSDLWSSISNWWNSLWSDKEVSVDTTSSGSGGSARLRGHATGGVFNREHVARFAEGNKAEAIIPLQNDTAMQPFVDAVSNGLLSSLMPVLSVSGGGSDLPPVYVGTLIADDKGLKELERKLKVIRVSEERRGN